MIYVDLNNLQNIINMLQYTLFLLSRWFQGAFEIFTSQNPQVHSKESRRVTVLPKNVEYLKTILPEEYEFYYFIKQRFDVMIKTIS